ncbi:MAG: dihydrodipicolinate synthase family protein [Mesorhizobium sp.]|nr:MAG: dihydrodipicolinate synthase family protein [Mesorhizobium sp.]
MRSRKRSIDVSELKGICVPICTPFKDNGAALDEGALGANIDSLIDAGIHIIAVNGGTGEFPFLTESEKRRIAEVAGKRINGRAKLIVQTSALRTEDAIENSKHARDAGADALLILPPFFEGPGEPGVRYHYEQISSAVNTPIMVYNIPQYTGFDITPDVYKRFSEIDTVKYIKDSTSNMMRIDQLSAQGAKVFNGCDYLNFYSLLSGAPGVFTGSGNAVPQQLVRLYDLVQSRNLAEATALWLKLRPLSLLLWTAPFNPVAKAASTKTGRPVGECRLPVLPLTAEEVKLVDKALAAAAA